MTTNLPAKADTPKKLTLRETIAKMEPEIAKALPGHIRPEQFVRTVQTAVAMTRNIEKVKDIKSLLAAITKAAADGLILDGREAALVVDYQGGVQYRPMMRGLLKLAHQSGEIKSIAVETVCDNDFFEYAPTNSDEPIKHKIDLKVARGEVYALYALAVMKTGGIVFEVMTIAQVNGIRDRSDAWKAFKKGTIKSTPWSTDWSEMARKTVFRRLSKYLPSRTDRDDFHSAVSRIDDDYSFEEPTDTVPAQPAQPTKTRGGAAAALKNLKPAQPAQEPANDQGEDQGQDGDQDHTDFDPDTGQVRGNGDGEDDQFQRTDEDF